MEDVDALIKQTLSGAMTLTALRDAFEDASWDIFRDQADPRAAGGVVRVLHIFSELDAGTATEEDVRLVMRDVVTEPKVARKPRCHQN
ncbi:hypothetical protein [Luteitalea sp.]